LSANHGKRQFSTKDCRFSFVLKAVRKTVDLFPITWYNIIDELLSEVNGMNGVLSFEYIKACVAPIAKKYKVQEIYLFGSYARGEADENSDLDFLVYGGEDFKLVMILAIAEELSEVFKKGIDAFEIREIKTDSEFYHNIMREKRLVA
jgi:predicted nucleotidyltransferase